LREQRLAGAGRTEEQDVGLGELDVGVGVARFGLAAGLDALVVVVYGYRERLLGLILTNDVAVEEVIDLARLRQLVEAELTGLGELFFDDFVPLCLPRSNGTWLGRTPRSRTVPGIVREVLCNRRVRRGDEPAPALRGSMP
jgi:hypothetical protein